MKPKPTLRDRWMEDFLGSVCQGRFSADPTAEETAEGDSVFLGYKASSVTSFSLPP